MILRKNDIIYIKERMDFKMHFVDLYGNKLFVPTITNENGLECSFRFFYPVQSGEGIVGLSSRAFKSESECKQYTAMINKEKEITTVSRFNEILKKHKLKI